MSSSSSESSSNPHGIVPEDHLTVLKGKSPSKYTDPCAKAAKLSMKCLEDNAYDRRKCADAFNNYRECKKAWIEQRRSDRHNNRPGVWE